MRITKREQSLRQGELLTFRESLHQLPDILPDNLDSIAQLNLLLQTLPVQTDRLNHRIHAPLNLHLRHKRLGALQQGIQVRHHLLIHGQQQQLNGALAQLCDCLDHAVNGGQRGLGVVQHLVQSHQDLLVHLRILVTELTMDLGDNNRGEGA